MEIVMGTTHPTTTTDWRDADRKCRVGESTTKTLFIPENITQIVGIGGAIFMAESILEVVRIRAEQTRLFSLGLRIGQRV